jgi:DNA-directed RNA polymerase specialized sigma24 family protein/uncharacterized membrane protein YgcG
MGHGPRWRLREVGTHRESDAVLLARVRDGDRGAFACLFERHAPAARRFARSLCGRDADADDITAEVFTSLFASLCRGRGPSELVLPYLFASIRNSHHRTAARRAHETALVHHEGVSITGWDWDGIVEADVVRRALATLNSELQVLLWRTEVDDDRPGVAETCGSASAHTLAVHRHRARRALGTAYLAQHAQPDGGVVELDEECRTTLAHLASMVRNRIGVRRRRRLEAHLADCEQCAQTRLRLERLNTQLRAQRPLPWNVWLGGLTSTATAQISGWLGTSAVTLAGSSALAMAALVPTPMALGPLAGAESQSTTSVASPARSDGVLAPQWSAGSQLHSEETASATGEVLESTSAGVPPIATSSMPAPPPTEAPANDLEPIAIVTTTADLPPGTTLGYSVDRPAMAEPLADDESPASADESATDRDEDGTDSDGGDDVATRSGQGQGPATGAAGGSGRGQSNDSDDGQGPPSSEGNGTASGPSESSGHGKSKRELNSADDGEAPSKSQGDGIANGPASSSGHGNGQAQAPSNRQGSENVNGPNGSSGGQGASSRGGENDPGSAPAGSGGPGHAEARRNGVGPGDGRGPAAATSEGDDGPQAESGRHCELGSHGNGNGGTNATVRGLGNGNGNGNENGHSLDLGSDDPAEGDRVESTL